MALLGLNLGQRCVVLTVFLVFGALSLFLIIFHVGAEAQFDQLKIGGAPFPGESDDNLVHFVQVSDIHISTHNEERRTKDFHIFCSKTLKLINPEVVVITGDLTDAKSANKLDSVQYQSEWDDFIAGIRKIDSKVLSIRGNHDSFNELDLSQSHYVQNLKNDSISTHLYTIQKPYGNYSLLSVDAAPNPGFKRPFNFVGYISDQGRIDLEQLGNEAKSNNQTVLYGHYPSSTLFGSTAARNLFSSLSIAYLCGHLHNGGGVIPKMQHMHRNGVAELELADWKKNRMFRILSFDHDIFSYSDQKWKNQGIYIHITNPPQWQFTNPSRQPVDRIEHSTHVRTLIFSEEEISSVMANIDGETVPMQRTGTNLWTAPWEPKSGTEGTVRIDVNTSTGNASSVHQYKTNYDSIKSSTFSTTGTFILSVDFCVYFAAAFWLGLSIPLFFMFSMSKFYSRMSSRQAHEARFSLPHDESLQLKWNFFLRFQILFGYDPYFRNLSLPLACWSIWIMFLPWFVGNVVDSPTGEHYYGFVSTWGIFYDGKLHNAHEVFASGFWDIVTFLWPTLLYCSYFSERLWSSNSVRPCASVFNFIFLVLIGFILVLRVVALISISHSYGWMAGCLSPVFMFPPIFIIFSSYFIYFKSSV